MPHQCCTMLQNPLKPIYRRQKPQKEQAIRMFDSHSKDCKRIESKKRHTPKNTSSDSRSRNEREN